MSLDITDRLIEFEKRTGLTDVQRKAASEIRRRLPALEKDRSRLTEINQLMIESTASTRQAFDVDPDDRRFMVVSIGGKVVHRFKVSDKPLGALRTSTFKATYKADSSVPNHFGLDDALLTDLETTINGFYTNAHRILKLVGVIFGKRKFTCNEISLVRNHLLEHPDENETPYNFGFGPGGPFVRPVHISSSPNDQGLEHNAAAFSTTLQAAFPQ